MAAEKPTSPFVYLGIPQWVLDYRPKMPSRKMMAFYSVTLLVTGAYGYDRYECHRIKEEYVKKVQWMREQPNSPLEDVRRARVFCPRIPDDSTAERAAQWFKRYMRPILVAAGLDFELIIPSNPGGLGRSLIYEITAKRIRDAAKLKQAGAAPSSPTSVTPEESGSLLDQKEDRILSRELVDGVYVFLGRPALKEYLWALRKGYGEEIDLDKEAELARLGLAATERREDARWEREEELLVRELEREDATNPVAPFDEIDDGVPPRVPLPSLELLRAMDAPGSDVVLPPKKQEDPATPAYKAPIGTVPFVTDKSKTPQALASKVEPSTERHVLAPTQIPPQPPFLLVPFSHGFGVRLWPAKLLHFFNKRQDVQMGADYALRLIQSNTRPFEAPKNVNRVSEEPEGILNESFVDEVRVGYHSETEMHAGTPTGSQDLDFMFDPDEQPKHFKKAYRSLPKGHAFHRREFYEKELPKKLKTARELARGEREPTKAEEANPPPRESDLRKDRLDKELKWRRGLQGWAIQRAGSGVAWDPAWGVGADASTPFRVVTPLTDEDLANLEAKSRQWAESHAETEEKPEA